jgi:hypothetical protein
MYKLEYKTNGIIEEIKSENLEPLQTMLRHLFALHNNYKGSTDNFELIYFGEIND